MPGSDQFSLRAGTLSRNGDDPPQTGEIQNSSVQAMSSAEPGGVLVNANSRAIDSISRMVLDAVSEGIVCTDRYGFTTFVNPAAVRMLGWTSQELVGKRQHEMIHHSHADGSPYSQADCPIFSVLKTGRAETCEDEVFWRKDGTSFAVSLHQHPRSIPMV